MFSVAAQAADTCESLATIGQGIMTARQQDVPKQEVVSYIESLARPDNGDMVKAAKGMVNSVYEVVEIQPTQDEQQRLIGEYRNWVLANCQKGQAAQ